MFCNLLGPSQPNHPTAPPPLRPPPTPKSSLSPQPAVPAVLWGGLRSHPGSIHENQWVPQRILGLGRRGRRHRHQVGAQRGAAASPRRRPWGRGDVFGVGFGGAGGENPTSQGAPGRDEDRPPARLHRPLQDGEAQKRQRQRGESAQVRGGGDGGRRWGAAMGGRDGGRRWGAAVGPVAVISAPHPHRTPPGSTC